MKSIKDLIPAVIDVNKQPAAKTEKTTQTNNRKPDPVIKKLHTTTPFEVRFTNQTSAYGVNGSDEQKSDTKRARSQFVLMVEWITPTKFKKDEVTKEYILDEMGQKIPETMYTYRGDDQLKYAKLAKKRLIVNELQALVSILRGLRGKYLKATMYNNHNPHGTRIIYLHYNDMVHPEINELEFEDLKLQSKLKNNYVG